jgi:hypothetical protein
MRLSRKREREDCAVFALSHLWEREGPGPKGREGEGVAGSSAGLTGMERCGILSYCFIIFFQNKPVVSGNSHATSPISARIRVI